MAKPTSLIHNVDAEPIITAESVKHVVKAEKKTKKAAATNQTANIKVSNNTKKDLDTLMQLTDHKFAYEMLETLIDYYVEHNLESDKKRAFKTLSSLKWRIL